MIGQRILAEPIPGDTKRRPGGAAVREGGGDGYGVASAQLAIDLPFVSPAALSPAK